jgi:hypothetical protein
MCETVQHHILMCETVQRVCANPSNGTGFDVRIRPTVQMSESVQLKVEEVKTRTTDSKELQTRRSPPGAGRGGWP